MATLQGLGGIGGMSQTAFERRICDFVRCRREFQPVREGQRFCCPACRRADWAENHPRSKTIPEDHHRDRLLFGKQLKSEDRLEALTQAAERILTRVHEDQLCAC